MSEWSFKRSVPEKMLEAIESAYNKGEWIKQYMDASDIFLAVRDSSLNFYYQGNSILQLLYKNGSLDGKVHYKYLLDPTFKPEYFSVNDNQQLPKIDPKAEGAVGFLKKSCKPYAGSEKEQLQKLVKSNANIVDMEISFSKDDATKGQNRIDFCALLENSKGLELCFFEAKDYANKEVRNGKVANQIKRYEEALIRHEEDIKVAYKECFKALMELNPEHPAKSLMEKALAQGFSISTDVRLVVFGFDQEQKVKLKSLVEPLKDLGLKHVLIKGDAKDFCAGISNMNK